MTLLAWQATTGRLGDAGAAIRYRQLLLARQRLTYVRLMIQTARGRKFIQQVVEKVAQILQLLIQYATLLTCQLARHLCFSDQLSIHIVASSRSKKSPELAKAFCTNLAAEIGQSGVG